MKLFIKISFCTLAIAGIILLVFPTNWFPIFYDVRYMGWSAIVEATLIQILPRLMTVSANAAEATKKNHTVLLFQFLLAFSFLVSAFGDLGLYQLYKVGFEYDKVLHFLIPLASVVIISMVLRERFEIRASYSYLIAFLFVIFCGVSWEGIEYLADHFLKTHMDGIYGMDVNNDTKFDLLFDFVGSFIGTRISRYIKTKDSSPPSTIIHRLVA